MSRSPKRQVGHGESRSNKNVRYDASAYSIEEGVVNALGFANREGADPDTLVLSFGSYTALENALGAKVQYVDIKHEEAAIAFEGIRFHSAYGYVTVFADRSMIPQTGFALSMDTWKLRSLGKQNCPTWEQSRAA